MLKKLLFIALLPVITYTMQSPAQKKIIFMRSKIEDMTNRLVRSTDHLCSGSKAPDILKMEYCLTSEVLSEQLSTLLKIHESLLPALDDLTRKRAIYILQNTDPAKKAHHALLHEHYLYVLNQVPGTAISKKQWAIDYDKQNIDNKKQQRYGTCFDQNYDVQTPVAACSYPNLDENDAHKINARRKALGLSSIEDQLTECYDKDHSNKQKECKPIDG